MYIRIVHLWTEDGADQIEGISITGSDPEQRSLDYAVKLYSNLLASGQPLANS
jgi:hypothetical protein